MQNKSYTVYEIEKYTEGSLTKYKLNQAIKNGELKAEKMITDKKGRGTPNYIVYEDDLKDYLETVELNKKSKIFDTQESSMNFNVVLQNLERIVADLTLEHKKEINDLKSQLLDMEKRLEYLEVEKPSEPSVLSKKDNEKDRMNRRRELLLELANVGVFSVRKKNQIISELKQMG